MTNRAPRFDDEDRAAGEAASLLLRRIALVLVDDVRRREDFGEDEEAWPARVAELAEEFGGDEPPARVEIDLDAPRRLTLRGSFGEHSSVAVEVRADGLLSGSGIRRKVASHPIRDEDLTPEQLEAKRRRELAWEASRGKPEFRRLRYLRTVAAPPQPGTDLWVLAGELYDDGLVVDYTYEAPDLTEEQMREQAHNPYLAPQPMITLADDLGTEYYESGGAGYGGGPGACRAYTSFAPAVPADATVLRITTDSGTVELDLTS